jgi:hypothetical protein
MRPILADLGLITQGTPAAWAVTSPDGVHRYVLGRLWDDFDADQTNLCVDSPRPLWCFGMLNPSVARHDVDDRTLRKCIGFARRGGAGGLVIVNALAYSTPYPADMLAAHRRGVNVVGEHNEAAIAWALGNVHNLLGRNVAAWGNVPPKLRTLASAMQMQFRMAHSWCFGRTADGSPRHPLMLGYDTKPERWT